MLKNTDTRRTDTRTSDRAALAAISESLNSATVIAAVPHYYRAPSAR